ncbi:MAG: enoyl-CoA hydratase-related protein [Ilumatobacteraceae bacterium]
MNVGLFAAGGGLLRLPSRVGYGKAMEMAITADPITAEDGFEFGLIARLADKGEAVNVAMQLAERVAKNAPLAVAASKQLIKATQGCTEEEFWKPRVRCRQGVHLQRREGRSEGVRREACARVDRLLTEHTSRSGRASSRLAGRCATRCVLHAVSAPISASS